MFGSHCLGPGFKFKDNIILWRSKTNFFEGVKKNCWGGSNYFFLRPKNYFGGGPTILWEGGGETRKILGVKKNYLGVVHKNVFLYIHVVNNPPPAPTKKIKLKLKLL